MVGSFVPGLLPAAPGTFNVDRRNMGDRRARQPYTGQVRKLPIRIPNLELHVAHGCNLSCESCSHYSNHGHKGSITPEEAAAWMEPWAERLAPAKFSLLGGEPAINPRLYEFVPLARSVWPRTQLRVVSNGLLLHRHPDLPAALAKAGNAVLEVSLHHDSDAYRRRMEPVLALLDRWQDTHRIEVRLLRSYESWTRRYKGFGATMTPFEDERPRTSWQNCAARTCPQIHDGAIWKCAPLAYLPMQHAKYGLSEKWKPYLNYEPLRPGCSDEEVQAFFARQEESYCGMCPARPERFGLYLPYPERENVDQDGGTPSFVMTRP
jgi:hypothetical protein